VEQNEEEFEHFFDKDINDYEAEDSKNKHDFSQYDLPENL
jgi:hypothetical protein